MPRVDVYLHTDVVAEHVVDPDKRVNGQCCWRLTACACMLPHEPVLVLTYVEGSTASFRSGLDLDEIIHQLRTRRDFVQPRRVFVTCVVDKKFGNSAARVRAHDVGNLWMGPSI